MEALSRWVEKLGLAPHHTAMIVSAVAVLAALTAMWILDVVARKLLLRWAHRRVEASSTTYDDAFLRNLVFVRLAHIAPAVLGYNLAPLALFSYPRLIEIGQTITLVWIAMLAILILNGIINSLLEIYSEFDVSRRIPLKPVAQALKFLVVLGIGIAVFSLFIGKSPIVLFSGLGAMSAVLMLVFKDSILGLTAGIQLSVNHLVEVGDWIEVPKHGIDGDVLEVNLTSVVVQNWDKTIAAVPAYDLVSGSFRNWRGMSESGGRRIKRALMIDVASVRFCSDAMIQQFKRIQLISEYVENKLKELAEHNKKHGIDESVEVNGRRMTNLGTFRAYIKAYLARHPKVHQDMTLIVRHLPLTPQGLPIEIYVFSSDQRWAQYEEIAADILDHLLAASKHFDLRVFSQPSGADVRAMAEVLAGAKH